MLCRLTISNTRTLNFFLAQHTSTTLASAFVSRIGWDGLAILGFRDG